MRNLGDTLVPHKYTATFVRTGRKVKRRAKNKKRTALFIDITSEDGVVLEDHLWIISAYWDVAAFKPGDIISFTATPYRYIKGVHPMAHESFQSDIGLKDVIVHGVVGSNATIIGIVNKYDNDDDEEISE